MKLAALTVLLVGGIAHADIAGDMSDMIDGLPMRDTDGPAPVFSFTNNDPYWAGKDQFGNQPSFMGSAVAIKNLVAASSQALIDADGPLQLIVPPEGTRSKARYWKTGFYYIALGAQVPIVMAYMDYAGKRSGLGPVFEPTGDIEADMAAIKAFYTPFKGRNPDQFEQTD